MPKTVNFVVVLADGVRKRHYHKSDKGQITNFAVQLEVKIEGEWKVVIRYDCSHGFSHVDRYDTKGKKTKKALNLTFESALTFGDWDINKNWRRYRSAVLREKQ
jgi:hypothetical protein